MWEGVGDWTKTATYWPSNSSGYHSLSFPFSWAAQPGSWGPSLYWDIVLIPVSSLRLIWTSCHRDYIIIWHPPTSCERQNSHSIQPLDSQGHPWYLRPDAPVIYTGAFLLLTAWPGSICNICICSQNVVYLVGEFVCVCCFHVSSLLTVTIILLSYLWNEWIFIHNCSECSENFACSNQVGSSFWGLIILRLKNVYSINLLSKYLNRSWLFGLMMGGCC